MDFWLDCPVESLWSSSFVALVRNDLLLLHRARYIKKWCFLISTTSNTCVMSPRKGGGCRFILVWMWQQQSCVTFRCFRGTDVTLKHHCEKKQAVSGAVSVLYVCVLCADALRNVNFLHLLHADMRLWRLTVTLPACRYQAAAVSVKILPLIQL